MKILSVKGTGFIADTALYSDILGIAEASFHYQKGSCIEKDLFEGRKVSERIVSIDRHYVRPIVRGKETKSVEFGVKAGNIQIDGISFIEHLSFEAFNEGIRLKACIRMQQ